MTRKLFHSGNSTVVSLPAEVLGALELAEGDEVTVEVDRDRHQIVIAPVKPPVPVAQLSFLQRVDQVRDVD